MLEIAPVPEPRVPLRAPDRVSLAVLLLLSALLHPTSAAAQAAADTRASRSGPKPHVRPMRVTEQLDYCKALVAGGEDTATQARCFGHVIGVLDAGMRLRRKAPLQSPAYEAQLSAGAAELTERLEALRDGDAEQMEQRLSALDEAIHALRVALSRTAAAERVQLSLVSRGGASLGNWQAGFLYTITEWAKSQRSKNSGGATPEPVFSTVTGASAGAVNGFAATIEGCSLPNHSAARSLYYRIWIDLGLFGRHGQPGLFAVEEGGSTALSLFTDDAPEATLEKTDVYIQHSPRLPSCSVDFGFVATHLDPTSTPVHVRPDGDPILTTKKLKEKFAVRLDLYDTKHAGAADTEGPIRITNIRPSGAHKGDSIYYAGLGHEQDIPLQTLMLGVRASGAFPGAFPPVPLAYTRYVPGPGDSVIAKKEVATFIDGGILDNTPVGLAVALDAWRSGSTPPHSALDGLLPPEPRTYLFLEPLVTSWMLGNEGQARSRKARRDMLETYGAFVRDLLGTTTDAQLANTAEQYPFVRRESADWTEPRLSVPERHMPITGARFDHFMAFLERDFRVFDFYVGMADAYVHLERERCMAAADDAPCGGDDDMRQLDAELKTVNPYYQCMRAYYDSDTARVLKRITSDELPAECEVLEQELCIAPGPHDSPEAVEAFLKSRAVLDPAVEDRCLEPAIANHNFRALLAAMHNYKVWLQSDRYTEGAELDRFFEELGGGEQTERFIYVDLPTHLQRSDGYMTALGAKQAFRSLMQQGIEQLAEEQGRIGRYALLLGGRPAADAAFGKAYPKQIVGVGIAQNGFEAVYGLRILRSPWRWDTTFRFFNLGRESLAPGLDPFMGDLYLATQVTRILSPLKFLDFELGGGWALSERLAFNGINPGHVAFRTGPRAYIALVILQRIYLALNVDYYPVVELDPAYRNLGTTVADNWEFNLAAGWRFLY